MHECPDYANTGTCSKKRCRLPHVDRAGQIRKMEEAAAAANKAGDEADISSEEDDDDDDEYEEIDSEDVDSDDYESDSDDNDTEIILGGVDSEAVARQQDFVRF